MNYLAKSSLLGFCLFFFLVACQSQKQDQPQPEEPDEVSLFVGQQLPLENPLVSIALGSCNRQDLSQSVWGTIKNNEPDLWIWLGDNIYGDTENMEVLESKYLLQKYNLKYKAFRERVAVIGVWDDHDFGINDGGKEYPKKVESQALMLDFLDVPKDDPVRSQEGVYQSYTFGPLGKQVKVILLDARYFRDELERSSGGYQRYVTNQTGDILGEAQWEWLESELTNSSAQIHFIGSGIQMIPEEHGFEKWANFPKARTRLMSLLETTRPSRPILISGDRHISEFSKLELNGFDTPLYEFTSSGLTHSYDSFTGEPNKHRIGDVIFQRSYGLIKIDWDKTPPQITFQMKGLNGETLEELVLN